MVSGGKRKGAGRPKGQGKFGEKTKAIRVPESLIDDIKAFAYNKAYKIPLYSNKVAAGFPSPADDYIEDKLDLNQHLIKHQAATFFVRANGDSMIDCGIFDGDIMIVDRSIEPTIGKIVIAAIDGNLTVKRFAKINGKTTLLPENKKYKPIIIQPGEELHIWGVVTNVVHALT